MRKTALIAKVRGAANAAGVNWELVGQGNHEIWRCGTTMVTIPRHVEINELTARNILKTLDVELGKDWWK
jgi:hypothetical protein